VSPPITSQPVTATPKLPPAARIQNHTFQHRSLTIAKNKNLTTLSLNYHKKAYFSKNLNAMSVIVAIDAKDECFTDIQNRFSGAVNMLHADCLNFDEAKFTSEIKALADANQGQWLYAVFHDSIGGVTNHPHREQADKMNSQIKGILESFGFDTKIIYAVDGACSLEMANYVGEVLGIAA
jgi:hypothetical protein